MTTVYTIGVYGSHKAAFFGALGAAGIDVLLDIRRRRAVRGSRYAYANARRLIAELEARGIRYRHILALAPDYETLAVQHEADAQARQLKSQRTALAPAYLQRYIPEVLDRFDFAGLARDVEGATAPVLFCIERVPQACHRSLVAPRLARALGTDAVVHLVPASAA